MIHINMSVERFTLVVKGHAEPNESEQYREICAGASMLAQGMMASITKFQKEHNGIRRILYRGDPGDMILTVEPEPWAEATIRKRMRAYADGMELLALAHPGSVHMIRDGEEIKNFGGDENE